MEKIFDGMAGSEQKFYSPDINTVLDANQVEEQREQLASHPKWLARFNKNLVPVTLTWIWVRQSSRFSPDGWTFVKANAKYTTADGKEL